jgi:MYXO-CTERM domain-containing protein
MNARRVALLVVVVCTATVARPARAYRVDDDGEGHALHWGTMPVAYELVVSSVPGGIAGEAAVGRAFETWSEVSSQYEVRAGDRAVTGDHQYDQRNMVYWLDRDWPYDHRLIALTLRYFDRSDGRLLDADVVCNGEDYAWSVDGPGYDVENVLAHEAGHFAGLGHSELAEATMYPHGNPGETARRTLAGDDAAGLAAIYDEPASPDASAAGAGASSRSGAALESPGSGGCSVVGPGAGGGLREGWPSLAVLAWLWLRRRRARFDELGVSGKGSTFEGVSGAAALPSSATRARSAAPGLRDSSRARSPCCAGPRG